MAEPWIFAIDLGTGGPKCAAVSLGGELLATAAQPVSTRYTDDGGAVQDPSSWWEGIVSGARRLTGAGVPAGDLAGVGITGQWGSTVPIDADRDVVGECLLWADTRGRRLASAAVGGPVKVVGYSPGNILRWLQLTGGAPSPGGADPLGHELFLRAHQPGLYERVRTFLEPLDYLGMRLTGRVAATPASMILSWLTDNRPGKPLAYVPELARRAGRDLDRLPPLIPTGSVLGDILPAVAEELGLPRVPVVAGIPDLHTAVVGSGTVQPFEAHITISTTAWIGCEVPFKKTDVLHQVASVPGLSPGAYVVANNHETAGICLEWLRDSILAGADGRGATPDYASLTDLAAAAPAGADGVMFTPWLNGERTPVEDRNLRGAFLNLSLTTGRAHLVRALLEGVAFNARWLLDAVEKFVRRPLPTLRILGGGAQSDLWCQVHADVLNRRIEQVADPMHANLRGAALYAATRLGLVEMADVPAAVPVAATFDPSPVTRSTYEPMYAEFARLYGSLHGFYGRLNGRRR